MIDTLYVLDLDRTLIDTTRLNGVLMDAIGVRCGVEMRNKLQADEAAQQGKSFNTLSVFRRNISFGGDVVVAQLLEGVKQDFLKLAREQREKKHAAGGFFEPGARRLLESLPHDKRMIFTYGSNREWQTWKLEASGLETEQHVVVTGRDSAGRPRSKSELFTEAYDQTLGAFVFENVTGRTQQFLAKQLVVVDDKIDNLSSLPRHAVGYWYIPQRLAISEDEQVIITHLPPRVRVLRRLRQLTVQR